LKKFLKQAEEKKFLKENKNLKKPQKLLLDVKHKTNHLFLLHYYKNDILFLMEVKAIKKIF